MLYSNEIKQTHLGEMIHNSETPDFNLKDKLLDYMFDQNSKLTDQLAGVREDLRLQREQADRHHRDLKASLDRMEERAVAAERRAEAAEKRAAAEAEARAKAEKRKEELIKTINIYSAMMKGEESIRTSLKQGEGFHEIDNLSLII